MNKNCGTCGNYKGAKVDCGGNKWLIPQSATDSCHGRHWVPASPPLAKAKPLEEPVGCMSCVKNVSMRCTHGVDMSREFKGSPIPTTKGYGKGCSCLVKRPSEAPDVAQRWVDEYKADTGIAVPAEALQKDMDQKIYWNTIKKLQPESLVFGTHVVLHRSSRGSWFEYTDQDGTRVPLWMDDILWKRYEEAKAEKKTTCFDCSHFKGQNKSCGNGHFANNTAYKCHKFEIRFIDDKVVEQASLEAIREKALTKTTTTSKETSTMNAIIRLADSQLNKEMEEFGSLQPDIQEALVEMQEEAKKTAAKSAAAEVMKLLEQSNKSIETFVTGIRTLRKQIDNNKAAIETWARAKGYGLETSNFIPLAILAGQIHVSAVENQDLTKVPEGWKPAIKAETPTPEDKSA
jgi:hypothetical protein